MKAEHDIKWNRWNGMIIWIFKSTLKLEQRCFSKYKLHGGHRNWPCPSNSSEWGTKHVVHVNLLQIRSAVPKISAKNLHFFSMALTFDLDLQTHPSEGTNRSSLWIWCKSVQRFPRNFIHKHKSHSAKNRTLHSSLHAVKGENGELKRTRTKLAGIRGFDGLDMLI